MTRPRELRERERGNLDRWNIGAFCVNFSDFSRGSVLRLVDGSTRVCGGFGDAMGDFFAFLFLGGEYGGL